MKPIIPFALLGALLTVGSASAISTTPVGYYEFDGLAGGNVFIPGFVESAAFSGALTAAGTSTLTVSAGALVASAYDEGTTYATHYAEITSGPNAGVVFDIVSNTDTVITVDGDLTALSLVGDETITVRPHVTLKSVFSSAEASLAAYTDNATFYGVDGSVTTYYYGADGATGWSSDFATADGSDRPVPPGTGFVLGLAANTPLTIVGEVKESPTVVQLGGGVANIVGPVNPLVGTSTPLNDTGFGALLAFTDSITVYVGGPLTDSTTYYPLGDGTISDDFVNPTTAELDNTTGAVIVPASNSAVTIESGVTIAE